MAGFEALLWVVGDVLPYVTVAVMVLGVGWTFFKWELTPRGIMWAIFPAKGSSSSILGSIVRRIFALPGPRRFERRTFSLALAFHISFITSLLLHATLVATPVFPYQYDVLVVVDSVLIVSTPAWVLRRVMDSRVHSSPADYVSLTLLLVPVYLGLYIALFKVVDLSQMTSYFQGILTLHPVLPPDNPIFAVHLLFAQIYLMTALTFKTLNHPIAMYFGQKTILDDRHLYKE